MHDVPPVPPTNVALRWQAGMATAEAAEGAGEGAGCAASCFDTGICGLLDSSSWFVLDEALAFALPVIGTLFSCFR